MLASPGDRQRLLHWPPVASLEIELSFGLRECLIQDVVIRIGQLVATLVKIEEIYAAVFSEANNR